jgi:uncharacterized protein YcbK (DUF882 family)
VTPNKFFKYSEFRCRCGKEDCSAPSMDEGFLYMLIKFRERLGVPCSISSGARCKSHNAAEKGSKNSAHLYGRAVDILTLSWDTVATLRAIDIAIELGFQGIGSGHGILHLDIMHAYRLRWDYDVRGKAVNFRPLD